MKTIVTGAAGFIGSNLVRALIKKGRKVKAIDNVSRGSNDNLENLDIEVEHADLRDYKQASKVIEGADSIYHLAARVGSIDFLHANKNIELETLHSNAVIDINVFRACIETGIKRIVYSSSVSVYPIDLQQKVGVKFAEPSIQPINPEGGYGWAKLLGEVQLDLMDNCRSSIARIFNAYGEYCDFGKSAQVVPALVRKAINYPKEEFLVWGDGTQTRNFIYIADCIEALIKMEELASYPPLILNIGNPETVTIKELAQTAIRVSGKKIRPKFDPEKPVGPKSRIPDIARAQIKLRWIPETSLEEGVRHLYDWMEKKLMLT